LSSGRLDGIVDVVDLEEEETDVADEDANIDEAEGIDGRLELDAADFKRVAPVVDCLPLIVWSWTQ